MSGSTVAGLCRLSFRAPNGGFDLAVPVDVPLADLLPTVVGYAGGELDEEGMAHAGWVLQRLGGTPLDDEGTPASLAMHDGDVLYLRPRRDPLPPVHFDDLVDGLATGMRQRPDTWRPAFTHRLLLGLAGAVLALAFAAVLTSTGQGRIVTAAAMALALLLAAASASRAIGDVSAGTVLGLAAVPFLGLAGFLLPTATVGGSGQFGAQLLAMSSAGAGAAVLAVAAVAASAPLFLGVASLGVVGVLGAVAILLGLPVTGASAAVTVFTLLFGTFVPALAFRLSGLRLPPLPANAEQLQEGIDPHPSRNVLSRGDIADQYLTAFHVAIGLACVVGVTPLVLASGWPAHALAGTISLLLVLHGRAAGSLWQRLALVVPGGYGAAALLAGLIGETQPGNRIALAAALLMLAGLMATAAWSVPGRRLLPYWGRAVDVLHGLAGLSLVPLVLLLLGVFHLLRAING